MLNWQRCEIHILKYKFLFRDFPHAAFQPFAVCCCRQRSPICRYIQHVCLSKSTRSWVSLFSFFFCSATCLNSGSWLLCENLLHNHFASFLRNIYLSSALLHSVVTFVFLGLRHIHTICLHLWNARLEMKISLASNFERFTEEKKYFWQAFWCWSCKLSIRKFVNLMTILLCKKIFWAFVRFLSFLQNKDEVHSNYSKTIFFVRCYYAIFDIVDMSHCKLKPTESFLEVGLRWRE